MDGQELLLSKSEVSQLLRVSVRGLDRLRKLGRAPKSIKIGAKVLWRKQSVESWLVEQEQPRQRGRRKAS